MNVLILHAHPEKNSFSSSLKNIAVEHFINKGDTVLVKDLYAMNFNPVLDSGDFKKINDPLYFNAMKEQMHAFQSQSFSDDIQAEIDALKNADLIILNFPLWWSSFPAILKGWFDRVLAFGFAYHPANMKYETGAFAGKKAMCCIPIGGKKEAYMPGGEHIELNRLLDPIQHQILFYTGMTVMPPYVCHRPHLSNEETLKGYIEEYKTHLDHLDQMEPVYQPVVTNDTTFQPVTKKARNETGRNKLSIWLESIRPFSLTATLVPVLFGILFTLNFSTGTVDWFLALPVLIGAPLFQVAGNLFSDYFDFKKKVDGADTFGSSKVLVNGLLKPKEVLTAGIVSLMILFLIGMILVYYRGLPLLLIGLIGIAGSFFYSALKYRALGDLEIFFVFGPLMTFGTYYSLTGSFDQMAKLSLVSVPIALLVTAILHANNTRDIKFDTRANIKTLASVLGVHSSKNYYDFLLAGAYVSVSLLVVFHLLPVWSLLVFITFPLALKNIKNIDKAKVEQPGLIALTDIATAQLHLFFGLILCLSLFIQYILL